MLPVLLLPFFAFSPTAVRRPAVAARVISTPVMKSWTELDMRSKRAKLPAEVEELLSSDTDRVTTEILWAAFRSCYATEGDAIAAAALNTGTILPYLNSPGNIYGSYEVLVDLLGREGAQDVCSKNPGVLQCSPIALRRESPEAIVKAADQVAFFEGILGQLPPALRQNLDKVAFVLLALPVAKRLADCSGQVCG